MPQPDLWARIMDALDGEGVDDEDFETAAFVLLKRSFPTLSPVSGGTDLGRDADALDGDGLIRLLATTAKDPRANLRGGLRRMQEEGLEFGDVVFATSQEVSATRRRQLEEIADKQFGARLVMVYDQSWLAGELYHDAVWRERLLGVTGEPPALTPEPLSLSGSHLPSVEMVGRDAALVAMRAGSGDLVVVGASGLGKTRVVAELEDSVFVELHDETARIADDIRRIEPSSVVVDDAHEHAETLGLLRRIRQAGRPPFRIIATTWPETIEAVRDHLPNADELVLEPLERSESARILEGLGITNKLLVGEILDQAEGRPGWTLVLGDLARQEGVERVISGEVLIEQVGRFSRRLAEGPVALDLLARVATLGEVTDQELPKLAQEVGVPLPEVLEHLRRLGRHGLAEWSRARWTVRPERLRAALVAHHFFSEPPAASIDALTAQWPEKALAVASSIVSAALVGSTTPHHAAAVALRAVAAEKDLLSDEAGELLYSYSLTSKPAASWVVQYLSDVLPDKPPAPPGDHETLLGRRDTFTERARWGRGAAAAAAAAQKFALPEAFDLLGRMALRDDGPTNHSDHPRRRLLDLPTNVGPYWGTDRELRAEALRCAVRLAVSEDAAVQELTAELAVSAMSPQGRGAWLDPVDKYKFTWVDRLEDAEQLAWIAQALWPLWHDVMNDAPDAAVGTVLQLVDAWQRVATGSDDRLQPTREAREVAIEHVTEMLGTIRDRCLQSPGLATAWNDRVADLADPGGLEPIEVDADFSALMPNLELAWREREAERDERLAQLAHEWEGLSPGEVAGTLGRWLESAEAAGHHIGVSIGQLLEKLGRSSRPTGLLVEVLSTAELWQYAYALAATALEIEPDRWREWVPAGLDNRRQRRLVTSVVLTEGDAQHEVVTHTLNELTVNDAWVLEQVMIRRGSPDEVVRSLLTHRDPAVRSTTALEFRLGDMQHGLELPGDWYENWRGAFLETPPDLGPNAGWRLKELAKALAAVDPEVLTEWFVRSLDAPRQRLSHDAIELVGLLPRRHRLQILNAAGDHVARRWLICAAIAVDPDFVPELLDDGVADVEDVLLCIERDHRGPWFESVAPLLVRRGADARSVATHLQFGTGWGHESQVYGSLADYLETLIDSDIPELAEIGRVGQSAFRGAAAKAASKERENRIRGR